MITTSEKQEITINTLLYIIQKIGGTGDFHKVFKILYFADQKHLAKYGTAISQDNYIAMKYGPVPSMAYDILKSMRSDGLMAAMRDQFLPYFELIGNHDIRAKVQPELDYLSISEMQCLDESIKECSQLDFKKRTDKSHGPAWRKANENGDMDLLEIAREGGAQNGMIDYIKESIENQSAAFE